MPGSILTSSTSGLGREEKIICFLAHTLDNSGRIPPPGPMRRLWYRELGIVVICISSYASDDFFLGGFDDVFFLALNAVFSSKAFGIFLLFGVYRLVFFWYRMKTTASPAASHLEVAMGYETIVRLARMSMLLE